MPIIDSLSLPCRAYIAALSPQEDAAIVAAMAERAREDADIVTELLEAGCSMDECAAVFSDCKVVN